LIGIWSSWGLIGRMGHGVAGNASITYLMKNSRKILNIPMSKGRSPQISGKMKRSKREKNLYSRLGGLVDREIKITT
jgi:hypothetical protein